MQRAVLDETGGVREAFFFFFFLGDFRFLVLSDKPPPPHHERPTDVCSYSSHNIGPRSLLPSFFFGFFCFVSLLFSSFLPLPLCKYRLNYITGSKAQGDDSRERESCIDCMLLVSVSYFVCCGFFNFSPGPTGTKEPKSRRAYIDYRINLTLATSSSTVHSVCVGRCV